MEKRETTKIGESRAELDDLREKAERLERERNSDRRQFKDTKLQIQQLVDELSLELDREKRQREDVEARLERERKINRMQVR